VVADCGRTELRNRSLPARAMAYFSIGMALHCEDSYEDVLGLPTDGSAWTSGEEPIALPSKSAIFQARARLGSEPLQQLFSRVAAPLAGVGTPRARLGGRRPVPLRRSCAAPTPEVSTAGLRSEALTATSAPQICEVPTRRRADSRPSGPSS
jgi:hypothetical protein